MSAEEMHHKRTTCRACSRAGLTTFLELGPTALANSFPASPAEFASEPRFTLDVAFCNECSLVQLTDVVDPEVLFRNYVYVTGTSETMATHFRAYARRVVERLGLGAGDLVVEAASNDGSLLAGFAEEGTRVLGVEPARNIAARARERGIPTVDEFFEPDLARALRAEHGPAKAVVGNNVLAHVPEPVAFLSGFRELLAPGGLAVTEVPYAAEFVERLEYDTVYHEHLCYFSVTALMRLFEEAGLRIVDIERYPVHGGTLRVHAASDAEVTEHAAAVHALAHDEAGRGLTDLARYERFAREVATNQQQLVELLRSLKAKGRTIGAYGAPAKGNTLLQSCGIDTDLLPWTVDKNPLKVGRYTPGAHLPVLPAEALLERQPDYCLILAWNLADEIMGQQAEYTARGGRFLLPIPEPRVVT